MEVDLVHQCAIHHMDLLCPLWRPLVTVMVMDSMSEACGDDCQYGSRKSVRLFQMLVMT